MGLTQREQNKRNEINRLLDLYKQAEKSYEKSLAELLKCPSRDNQLLLASGMGMLNKTTQALLDQGYDFNKDGV
jgi:hypothetical protein